MLFGGHVFACVLQQIAYGAKNAGNLLKWKRNHKDFEGAAGSRNSKDRLARPRRAAGVLQTQQNAEGLERIAKSRALPAH